MNIDKLRERVKKAIEELSYSDLPNASQVIIASSINELRIALKDSEAKLTIAREALEEECCDRCNAEYNPCWARVILKQIGDGDE